MRIFKKPLEFDWDDGNRGKNKQKHGVSDVECEEVFFDPKKKVLSDPRHSRIEERSIVVGRTKSGRGLFVVFTQRGLKIRIVSARDLNKRKEKEFL